MKKMKKVMALLLSLVMVLAMSVVAFATEEGSTTSGTYTITAPATSHQYEIYQIFTGDLSGTILSNVKWGANGTVTKGEAVSQDVIDALTAVNGKTDVEKLEVIKQYANLTSTPVGTVTNGSTYEAEAGYYLIKDKDNTVSGTDAYTLYIVKVVGNVDIDPKSEVPSFEKKLKDKNDTDGTETDWQDSADYDIGDEIPFKLEGKVAANYSEYKQYYFAFHDEQEDGLTFNASTVKVFVGDVEVTQGYQLNITSTDGCTFEVVFEDLKAAAEEYGYTVENGTKIRVEYTATLNKDAVLGSHGNLNKAKLEFSNNPNEEQEGHKPETGETPWDNVIVFTYKVVINKIDSDRQPLAGAEFTLTKEVKDGDPIKVAVIKSTDGTSFTFKGLDDGKYTLTETKTPAEYNTIAPITFTVNADHTITWDGTNRDAVLTELTGTKVTGEITFTENKTEGSLNADVVNNKGSELPSTGGMGTTIFYVVGSILVLGAAILLITKKRMSAR